MNQKSQDLDFLKNTMVQNINRLLYKKNWSIRQLSDQAGLPYESINVEVNIKCKGFLKIFIFLIFFYFSN